MVLDTHDYYEQSLQEPLSRRVWKCGFSQSPHAQEASIFLVFYTV